MQYTEQTKQGYKILSLVRITESNTAIVFKRTFANGQEDYGWGNYYDEATGIWGHGHYDFATQEAATRSMLAFKATEGDDTVWNVMTLQLDEYGEKIEEFNIRSFGKYADVKEWIENNKNDNLDESEGDTIKDMNPVLNEIDAALIANTGIEVQNETYGGYIIYRSDDTIKMIRMVIKNQLQ